jgi:molecular chaperone GrpE
MTDEIEKNETENASDMATARPEVAETAPGAPEPAATAEEVAELKDRLLRALADTENLRRRTARELDDARKYAVTGFARDLLEVSDNLSRALASVPPEARTENEFLGHLVTGVEMTERLLLTMFERHKVQKVLPVKGERFDHNRHQAMFEMPAEGVPPGTIAEVLQPGYVIADRLLRPALVGVAKAASRSTDGGAGGPPSGDAGSRIDTTA